MLVSLYFDKKLWSFFWENSSAVFPQYFLRGDFLKLTPTLIVDRFCNYDWLCFRFLKNTINPFVRLNEINEADQFLLASDVSAVLAYFNFAQISQPSGYDTFHWTSLKMLENDPLRDQMRFAVITNVRVARYYNFFDGETRFYNWSSAFDNYTVHTNWNRIVCL